MQHQTNLHWALNELVSKRNTLVKNNVILKNQLHTYLNHNYPSYSKFFFSLDSKTALEFFKEYSYPSKLKTVPLHELTAFLSKITSKTFTNFFNVCPSKH